MLVRARCSNECPFTDSDVGRCRGEPRAKLIYHSTSFCASATMINQFINSALGPRFPTSIWKYGKTWFIWILTCLAMPNAERSKERITERLGAFWCWAGPSCAAWLEISWDFIDQTKSSQAYTQPYSLLRIISHIEAPWQPVLNALGTNCVFLCCFSLLDPHF